MSTIYENHLIRLRQAKTEDAAELFQLTQDEEVMRYYGTGAYHSMDEAIEEINWFKNLSTEGTGFRWVIADINTNQYIGDIGLFHLNVKHRRVEIGFKLNKAYWNKGIMRECIKVTLNAGFQDQEYNRIEALVDPRNIGCQKTLLSNGFQQDGLLREYEWEHGQFVDLGMYSMLKKDWTKVSL
ncbi:GNAT family N-acetyltransferase [Brevibacillus daliensis]|uniref:GNAT family N-acetyltransferase n=1 Tax=Brevibacillus daliensis TaxID=2892995 RepID=UPI001E3D7D56|nr:GNAT family N-acetyltransferase [Brevibacillus daliensis]